MFAVGGSKPPLNIFARGKRQKGRTPVPALRQKPEVEADQRPGDRELLHERMVS